MRPGRWSRSVRARAAGVGPACSRRHATRAGTDEAPARRRANKNPDRRKRAGLDETRYLRLCENPFREGNDPCFHRVDCPVGGSFCTASCFFVRTHSLPQETSAGRNLITLFVHVNIPAQLFSRRPPVPRAMRARRRAPTSGSERADLRADRARHIRKLHKKRHFENSSRSSGDARR